MMTREYTTMSKGGGMRWHYKETNDVPAAKRHAVVNAARTAASVLECPEPQIVFLRECGADEAQFSFKQQIVTHSRRRRSGGSVRDIRHIVYCNNEMSDPMLIRDVNKHLEAASKENRAASDKIVHSNSYDRG
jgi:hypothetical protein